MEKGIKAYHSYLSFGDAKEALSETVCEDLNLDDLCEQLDYTSSCVGRQYLYHILCTDKISDVTAHEQFIEQLQTDYLLRNKLVNALQKLNKPDAYSIVDILAEKEHTYSRGYLLLLQICRWLPAVSLILMFQIPSSPVPPEPSAGHDPGRPEKWDPSVPRRLPHDESCLLLSPVWYSHGV